MSKWDAGTLRWATNREGRLVVDGPNGLWAVAEHVERGFGDALIILWNAHREAATALGSPPDLGVRRKARDA